MGNTDRCRDLAVALFGVQLVEAFGKPSLLPRRQLPTRHAEADGEGLRIVARVLLGSGASKGTVGIQIYRQVGKVPPDRFDDANRQRWETLSRPTNRPVEASCTVGQGGAASQATSRDDLIRQVPRTPEHVQNMYMVPF